MTAVTRDLLADEDFQSKQSVDITMISSGSLSVDITGLSRLEEGSVHVYSVQAPQYTGRGNTSFLFMIMNIWSSNKIFIFWNLLYF